MKRFIIVFSFTIFLMLFMLNYSSYKNQQYESLVSSSDIFQYEIKICEDSIISSPHHLNTFLKRVAIENNVNVIRTVSYYDNKTKQSYTEDFIFLTNETSFFKQINLNKGRYLTIDDMENHSLFLSTKNTGSKNQIGIISNFGGDNNYSIYGIDELINRFKYAGTYKLECYSEEQYEKFLNDYVNYYNEYFDDDITADELRSSRSHSSVVKYSSLDIFLIVILFILIIFFTFLFYIVSSTKTISIMKLNGYTLREIVQRIIVTDLSKIFLFSSFIIMVIMIFIKDNNIEFIKTVYITNLFAFILILTILSITCAIYSKTIKITHCIKGKKPINKIIFLNCIFKIFVSIIVFSIMVNLIGELGSINNKKMSLDNWDAASDYAAFHPFKSGNDREFRTGVPTYHLYKYLNENYNAIYMYSNDYTYYALESENPEYIRSVRVNPNYLIKYPILDTDGNPIVISEDVKETIYLVPEQYKDMEEYHYEYFTAHRQNFHDTLHVNYYNQEEKNGSTDVVFIYTKSGQDIFSMNTNVFPNNNNNIRDPIVHVITESNCIIPDTHYETTGYQHLFIELIYNENTYESILPKLKELSLDDNMPYLVRVNDLIYSEINDLQKEIIVLVNIFMGLSILLIITILQSIFLIFQKNKFEYFLKKAFGRTFMEKYKKIIGLLLVIYIIEFILLFIFISSNFFVIFVLKTLVELIITLIIIMQFEKYNVLRVLKEGV